MSTEANVRRSLGSRFYTPLGDPVYEIPKKSGKGMKRPTIIDAIENGWLPSVTTVINSIAKPGLQNWLTEQAVLAVLTTPRLPGEKDDEFVYRVLHVECVQDEQADKAAQLGSDIHSAISDFLNGKPYPPKFDMYVSPVLYELVRFGRKVWTEKVLVGDGYAGRADYLGETNDMVTLVDFKTTGKIPEKEAYDEHKMQVAAYAKAHGNTADKHIQTAVIYISTSEPGRVITHIQEDWLRNYEEGFKSCLGIWRFMNGVRP